MHRKLPVFLVGSERSGTTLLRLMLDHHPEIAFNLESDFLTTRISDDGVFPEVGDYIEFLRNDRVFLHSRFEIRDGLDFVGLAHDFLEQKRMRDRKAIAGATVHYQFSKLGRIWPRAKYIHLFRDGRDVAHSVVQMGWAGNAYVGADWWLKAETEWENYRATLGEGSWIEVRYEELIANPVEQLTRICHFIGVDYSSRMFDYVKHTSYRMPDLALTYQWKHKLCREEIQKLEARIGDRLLSKGYGLSGYPRIELSRVEKRYLRMHSKVGALGYRLRKYGAMLLIQYNMARRLGRKEWSSRIGYMLNAIDDAYIK